MAPKLRHVRMKDVPIMLLKEEYVYDMVHHGRNIFAIMKEGVPTKLSREGYVRGMVPKLRLRLAATKDVPIQSGTKWRIV